MRFWATFEVHSGSQEVDVYYPFEAESLEEARQLATRYAEAANKLDEPDFYWKYRGVRRRFPGDLVRDKSWVEELEEMCKEDAGS